VDVDEARRVIERLERIEALQSSRAPAEALLGEVRQLLREGEAWLAAEHHGAREAAGGRAADLHAEAAAALDGCRATLAEAEEVVPGKARSAAL
jgi:hypothetical protein